MVWGSIAPITESLKDRLKEAKWVPGTLWELPSLRPNSPEPPARVLEQRRWSHVAAGGFVSLGLKGSRVSGLMGFQRLVFRISLPPMSCDKGSIRVLPGILYSVVWAFTSSGLGVSMLLGSNLIWWF